MRTFEFSRHNALIITEDSSSLEIQDTLKARVHYTVLRSRGRINVRIVRVETEAAPEIWVMDHLPNRERNALKEHIEKLYEEDAAEDARNVREVAQGYV